MVRNKEVNSKNNSFNQCGTFMAAFSPLSSCRRMRMDQKAEQMPGRYYRPRT